MKTYSIVGQKHLNLDPYLTGIVAGVDAVLVREPTNKFDPNAVQVWIGGNHVGYVPAKDARVLAPFIDQTGKSWVEQVAMLGIAVDANAPASSVRSIPAKFVRSPNSAYPQVQVSE
jgi:hypothetical protein